MVVDDHKLVREGLIRSMSQVNGIRVIAEAENGREAIDILSKRKLDVIILDLNMPLLSGLETLKKIRELGIKVKIIILTAYPNKGNIMKAMKFGANGFVSKDIAFTNFIDIINKVYKDESFLEPELSNFIYEKDNLNLDKSNNYSKIELLSAREYEILELISFGYSNMEIGKKIFISEKTVKNHITSLYNKIQVSNRTEAVIFCYENEIREIGLKN